MRREALVAIFVLVSACGGAPSAPSAPSVPVPTSPAAAPFAGLWTATYRYTKCDGLRDCFALRGTIAPFTLRLVQAGAHVSGLVETRNFVVAVAGVSDPSGRVTLTGSVARASPVDYYGDVQVSNFRIALDPAAGLSGSVEYTTSGGGPFSGDAATISYAATIVTATEQPLTDLAGWTGTWRGRFVIRNCTSVGWNGFCSPEQANSVWPLTLTISDAGLVSGQLMLAGRLVPVIGLVSGGALHLSGELSQPESGGPMVTRILEFSGAGDQFGRLTGPFHYEVVWTSTASTYDAELWEVVKQP